MRSETLIVSPEPDCSTAPDAGLYACVIGRGMPESAVRLKIEDGQWHLYINGKLKKYAEWQDMTKDHPYGLAGRIVRDDEYNRILRERLQDMRDGGVVPLDAMTHPAPQF